MLAPIWIPRYNPSHIKDNPAPSVHLVPTTCLRGQWDWASHPSIFRKQEVSLTSFQRPSAKVAWNTYHTIWVCPVKDHFVFHSQEVSQPRKLIQMFSRFPKASCMTCCHAHFLDLTKWGKYYSKTVHILMMQRQPASTYSPKGYLHSLFQVHFFPYWSRPMHFTWPCYNGI